MINSLRKLLATNFIVQILGLLIYPILMINYSVEDLSKYGLFYGGMTIVSVMLTFKIENLFFNISLRECLNLYVLYFKKIYPFLLLILILSYLSIVNFFEANVLYLNILIALCAGVFLSGFNIVYNFLVRINNSRYNLLKIFRIILELAVVLVFSFFDYKIDFLFFLVSLSYFVVILFPIYRIIKNKVRSFGIRKNLKFIFLDLYSSIFNNIYLYSPNYFLYFGGSKELSGYYFLINRFVGVPSIMIAQSLSTAVKQNFSSMKGSTYKMKLNNFNVKIFNKIYLAYVIGVCFSVIIVWFLDKYNIYNNLFYIYIITIPMMVVRFKFLSYSGLFYVLKAYKENLNIQFMLFLVCLISFVVGYFFKNVYYSLFFYSVLTMLIYEFSCKYIVSKEKYF